MGAASQACRSGTGGGAAPAPPTADRLHWPQGASRHTGRTALIGPSREPRPLSCSRAGFSIAAIFVDVSAPRGFGEAAAERARRRPSFPPLSPACPGVPHPTMEKLVPKPELGVRPEARRSGVSARGAPGADGGVAVAARRGCPPCAPSCKSWGGSGVMGAAFVVPFLPSLPLSVPGGRGRTRLEG